MKTIRIILLFIFLGNIVQADDYWKSQKYADMLTKLEKEGFSKKEIVSLFSDPRIKLDPEIPEKFKKSLALEPDYSTYLREERVQEGVEFLIDHKELLEKVEERYGVDKEIIVALFRIESSFGTDIGSYRAFNVFNSLVFYETAGSWRSRWAKKELISLLKICRNLNIDPLEVRSSWAGAIGYPQFMPTSYLSYAVDGDKDKKVNLFTFEDSAFSIGNYLVENDWHRDKSEAIKRYNNSQKFVDFVEEYARKVKEKMSKSRKASPRDE